MFKEILKTFIILFFLSLLLFFAFNPSNFLSFFLSQKGCWQTNQHLLKENIFLKNELLKSKKREKEFEKIKEFCLIKEANKRKYLLGQVVGLSPFNLEQKFFINLGKNDGLEKGMPVVLPFLKDKEVSLIGSISKVGKKRTEVISLYDKDFSASCYILTKDDKKIIGLVKGEMDKVVLDLIPKKENISLGDYVFTTGFDKKFPPDLYLGKIKKIKQNGGVFKEIEIEPPFSWQEIDKVLVITNY